jgi:transcriptional regulator with XRE-family HTH domain
MGRETLADYVRRVRHEKSLSLGDVKRASGNQIASSHVSRIENGDTRNITVDKLVALARGLDTPADEVFAVARGVPPSEPEALDRLLLTLFHQLPDDRQADVMRIVRSLHREHGVKPATDTKAADAKRKSK